MGSAERSSPDIFDIFPSSMDSRGIEIRDQSLPPEDCRRNTTGTDFWKPLWEPLF